MSGLSFFRSLLSNPIRAGAVAPSGRSLTRQMVSDLDLTQDRIVVELGSGTGVFSAELLERMQGRGKLIMVERSEELAELLRLRFPNAVVICDCMSNLGSHLEELGVKQVDYIVSGLPWTLFPKDLQERGLQLVARYLKPGGTFVTFIYLHGMLFYHFGISFESRFRQILGRFSKSRPVWLNLPPARVWRWSRPMLPESTTQPPTMTSSPSSSQQLYMN